MTEDPDSKTDVERLQEIYTDAIQDRRELLWEDAEWQPPFEERDGIRDVTAECINEASAREWALYIAGEMAGYQQALRDVEMLLEESDEDD